MSWKMPPEWAPHKQTWMGWPVNPDTIEFVGSKAAAYKAWAEVANTISRFEPVTMVCDDGEAAVARKYLNDKVEVVERELGDSWMRDCGPTFVVNDTGELVLSPPLQRTQIRRYPRGKKGGWRFSIGVNVACPKEPFTAWISPHRQAADPGHGRPDQLRLIHEHDEYFQTLYGLRNDSEAINSHYKRTLIADRAAALGWQRQTLDLTSWALLTNTLAWHHHRV